MLLSTVIVSQISTITATVTDDNQNNGLKYAVKINELNEAVRKSFDEKIKSLLNSDTLNYGTLVDGYGFKKEPLSFNANLAAKETVAFKANSTMSSFKEEVDNFLSNSTTPLTELLQANAENIENLRNAFIAFKASRESVIQQIKDLELLANLRNMQQESFIQKVAALEELKETDVSIKQAHDSYTTVQHKYDNAPECTTWLTWFPNLLGFYLTKKQLEPVISKSLDKLKSIGNAQVNDFLNSKTMYEKLIADYKNEMEEVKNALKSFGVISADTDGNEEAMEVVFEQFMKITDSTASNDMIVALQDLFKQTFPAHETISKDSEFKASFYEFILENIFPTYEPFITNIVNQFEECQEKKVESASNSKIQNSLVKGTSKKKAAWIIVSVSAVCLSLLGLFAYYTHKKTQSREL